MADEAVVTGFFKRQQMLGEGASGEQLSKEAHRLAGEGLLDDAITFFIGAGDTAGLEKMALRCLKDGDLFGFEAASRALGKEPEAGEWQELGNKALAHGKLWFSYRAFEKAEDHDGLEKVRRRMSEEGVEPPQR
jgi:hypothetical protein